MFFLRKLALFVLISLSLVSLSSGEAIARPRSSVIVGKKEVTAVPIVRGGKSLGPITPSMVTTLNSVGSAFYGLRLIFALDDMIKSAYGIVPDAVVKVLGTVIGAVFLSHVAVTYHLKHIMKVSDADIAKCNFCYSAAYVGYHTWKHTQGVTSSLEGLIVSAFFGLLNAYAGYA